MNCVRGSFAARVFFCECVAMVRAVSAEPVDGEEIEEALDWSSGRSERA